MESQSLNSQFNPNPSMPGMHTNPLNVNNLYHVPKNTSMHSNANVQMNPDLPIQNMNQHHDQIDNIPIYQDKSHNYY